MTSKSKPILRKSQTGEPTNNVGHFGTHDHSAPECWLATQPESAGKAFAAWEIAVQAAKAAEDAVKTASIGALRERALARHPRGRKLVAKFNDWAEPANLYPVAVLDEQGTNLMNGFLDGPIQHMLINITRNDADFIAANFEVDERTGECVLILDSPQRRSLSEIDAESDEVDFQSSQAQKRQFDLAAEALAVVVLDRYPDAAVLELQDDNDGPGSRYYTPLRIVDGAGVELWKAYTGDADSDYFEELAVYTPTLDRRGRNAVALPGGKTGIALR